MRLLLDENVLWRLAAYVRPHGAAVLHMRDVGLDESADISYKYLALCLAEQLRLADEG